MLPAKVTVNNERYRVSYAVDQGLSVADIKHGLVFLQNGQLLEQGVAAESISVDDPKFGEGIGIQVTGKSGSQIQVVLFAALPFVIIRTRVRNSSLVSVNFDRTAVLQAALNLDTDREKLSAFGTGGPGAVSTYGSYCYLAVVEPKSRSGVVAGWISHDRGSGIVLTQVTDDQVSLTSRIDYGRLIVDPGSSTELESFAIGYFADCLDGLESYADAVAAYYAIELPEIPSVYCTWYDCGRAGTEPYLRQLTNFAAENLMPYGLSVIQIDDGWQMGERRNGPGKVFIDVHPNGPYPRGMQEIADYIKAQGLTAGIWLMPFAADQEDPFFQARIDWLVKNPDGQPWVSRWGGAALDMSFEPARVYLRSVLKQLVEAWGFKYLKMDGIYTGAAVDLLYVNDQYKEDNLGIPHFANPNKTPIEIYRDGLKLVREAVGAEVFLLGCCARQNMRSFGGSFGLVDAMRIGPDNGSRLDRILRGPQYGGQTYFLHGRVWINDPDPVYVRESVPYNLARTLTSWQAISGQLYTSSDNYPALPVERLELLKRTMANHGLKPRPLDLFERAIPSVWRLTHETDGVKRTVVAVFNWDLENSQCFSLSCADLGLSSKERYTAFDYWSNRFLGPIEERLELELAAADCAVLAIRPTAAFPQVISTSQHVTQGIIDLLDERWDSAANTLCGSSKLIAHDPYELRIACLAPQGVWQAEAVIVETAGGADVSAAIKEQVGGTLRVVLHSAASTTAVWKIKFAQVSCGDPYAGFDPLTVLTGKTDPVVAQQGMDQVMEEPVD